MHRYRTHTCGALGLAEEGKTVRLSGWCHRIRDHGGAVVHRPARPLRHHPMRRRSGFAGLRAGRKAALRMGGADRRRGAQASRRDREPRDGDRPGRGLRARDRGARAGRRAAAAGVRRPALSRGHAAQVPLPRPPAREAARQHRAARQNCRFAAPAHEDPGIHRVPDADPDRLEPRRGARLPGAVAHPPRQVLRPAAGAAAVQAAADDGGLRPLLPDRAVLPRRGPARRPAAGRVLPARHRDELRRTGRRAGRDGAGDPRRVRGIRRRQAGDAVAVAAHPVRRGDAQVRLRQAGSAQSDRHAGRLRPFPRVGLQGVRPPAGDGEERGVGDPGAGRRPAHVRRPDEFLGAGRGPAGPRLHAVLRSRQGRDDAAAEPDGDRNRRPRPARQQHRPGAHRGGARPARPQGGRRGVLRRRRSRRVRQVRRPGAQQGRRKS